MGNRREAKDRNNSNSATLLAYKENGVDYLPMGALSPQRHPFA